VWPLPAEPAAGDDALLPALLSSIGVSPASLLPVVVADLFSASKPPAGKPVAVAASPVAVAAAVAAVAPVSAARATVVAPKKAVGRGAGAPAAAVVAESSAPLPKMTWATKRTCGVLAVVLAMLRVRVLPFLLPSPILHAPDAGSVVRALMCVAGYAHRCRFVVQARRLRLRRCSC
jgi:hypothetical protein